MDGEEITYSDVKEYEKLFTLAPSFLLERFAKRNTNIVKKFESQVEGFLINLNENQKKKLDLVLKSDTESLQAIMADAYQHSRKKQYKILANPKYKEFVEINMNEIRKMVG